MIGFLRVTIGLSAFVQGLFVAHIAFPDTQQNHPPLINRIVWFFFYDLNILPFISNAVFTLIVK